MCVLINFPIIEYYRKCSMVNIMMGWVGGAEGVVLVKRSIAHAEDGYLVEINHRR